MREIVNIAVENYNMIGLVLWGLLSVAAALGLEGKLAPAWPYIILPTLVLHTILFSGLTISLISDNLLASAAGASGYLISSVVWMIGSWRELILSEKKKYLTDKAMWLKSKDSFQRYIIPDELKQEWIWHMREKNIFNYVDLIPDIRSGELKVVLKSLFWPWAILGKALSVLATVVSENFYQAVLTRLQRDSNNMFADLAKDFDVPGKL